MNKNRSTFTPFRDESLTGFKVQGSRFNVKKHRTLNIELRTISVIICIVFCLCASAFAVEPFTKTIYEEYFLYQDFDNWLGVSETIASQEVKSYIKDTSTETTSTMISDVSNDSNTKVNYKIKAGVAATNYVIKIKIVSSSGQKFEFWVYLAVK